MNQLVGWLKALYFTLLSANKVAKIRGVTYGKRCQLRTKKFGSEPYLISIGDDFKTAGEVQFVTHDGAVHVLRNLYPEYHNIDSFGKITIGDNVFVGYGAIIMPNTIIGDNVIVGAGSIVKGTLESNSVYAGVPVRRICSLDAYVKRHKDNFVPTKGLNIQEKRTYLEEKFMRIEKGL